MLTRSRPILRRRTLRSQYLIRRTPMLLGNTRPRSPLSAYPIMPKAIRRNRLTNNQRVQRVALRMPLNPLPLNKHKGDRSPHHTKIRMYNRPFSKTTLANYITTLRSRRSANTNRLSPFLRFRRLNLRTRRFNLMSLILRLKYLLTLNRKLDMLTASPQHPPVTPAIIPAPFS